MQNCRHIVAATDFSENGSLAVGRAAGLARQHQSRLELLHVLDESLLASLGGLFRGSSVRPADEAQRLLQQAAAGTGLPPPQLGTTLVIGKVADEVAKAASSADLLVLGAKGMNPVQDLLIGTTATRILRRCRKPVLVVREPAENPYEKVLIPLDLTPRSVQVIAAARAIAPTASLTLLHAVDLPYEGKLWLSGVDQAEIDGYRRRGRDAAHAAMQALAGDLPMRCVAIRGDPAPSILKQAATQAVDLVVVGKNTTYELAELVLGSTSRHVLSDLHCDVMIVPAWE